MEGDGLGIVSTLRDDMSGMVSPDELNYDLHFGSEAIQAAKKVCQGDRVAFHMKQKKVIHLTPLSEAPQGIAKVTKLETKFGFMDAIEGNVAGQSLFLPAFHGTKVGDSECRLTGLNNTLRLGDLVRFIAVKVPGKYPLVVHLEWIVSYEDSEPGDPCLAVVKKLEYDGAIGHVNGMGGVLVPSNISTKSEEFDILKPGDRILVNAVGQKPVLGCYWRATSMRLVDCVSEKKYGKFLLGSSQEEELLRFRHSTGNSSRKSSLINGAVATGSPIAENEYELGFVGALHPEHGYIWSPKYCRVYFHKDACKVDALDDFDFPENDASSTNFAYATLHQRFISGSPVHFMPALNDQDWSKCKYIATAVKQAPDFTGTLVDCEGVKFDWGTVEKVEKKVAYFRSAKYGQIMMGVADFPIKTTDLALQLKQGQTFKIYFCEQPSKNYGKVLRVICFPELQAQLRRDMMKRCEDLAIIDVKGRPEAADDGGGGFSPVPTASSTSSVSDRPHSCPDAGSEASTTSIPFAAMSKPVINGLSTGGIGAQQSLTEALAFLPVSSTGVFAHRPFIFSPRRGMDLGFGPATTGRFMPAPYRPVFEQEAYHHPLSPMLRPHHAMQAGAFSPAAPVHHAASLAAGGPIGHPFMQIETSELASPPGIPPGILCHNGMVEGGGPSSHFTECSTESGFTESSFANGNVHADDPISLAGDISKLDYVDAATQTAATMESQILRLMIDNDQIMKIFVNQYPDETKNMMKVYMGRY